GVLGTMAMENGMPVPVGILVGLLTGLFWGSVNGFLTTRLRIAPFIVTLGTLGIIRGLTLIITNGLPVTRVSRSFAFLGEGNLLGVPFVLWVVVICALATHVILEHTRLGRYAFAIGSNPDAAVYAGVPVAFDTTVIYALGGLLTGLAGMIEASRLMTGQPSAGNGYELQAIAAAVIGGGSLHGGEGSVIGTLIGALIMGLLSNGSDLLGISPYLQQAIIGGGIILAVTVDELRKRRGRAGAWSGAGLSRPGPLPGLRRTMRDIAFAGRLYGKPTRPSELFPVADDPTGGGSGTLATTRFLGG